ncbi:MAG: hypothetical protein HC888_06590, partial [Candidatus Competibacteraceae bacterium]|nr:hypothetical protein [Candidatus Competibacteraceae bacterium]
SILFSTDFSAQDQRWFRIRVDPDSTVQVSNCFTSFGKGSTILIDPRSHDYGRQVYHIKPENDDSILQRQSAICSYEIPLIVEQFRKN